MKNVLFSFFLCMSVVGSVFFVSPVFSHAAETDEVVTDVSGDDVEELETDAPVLYAEAPADYSEILNQIYMQLDNLNYRTYVPVADDPDAVVYPLNKFEYRVLQFLQMILVSNIMLLCCSVMNFFIRRKDNAAC